MLHTLIAALSQLASYICPNCGWWAEADHTCHPADR